MPSGRKPSLKAEVEEELIEAVSFYSNFISDLDKITALLDLNESLDHANDKTRTDTISHLLKALESYSAKNYEDVDRFVHAAIQRLHQQEVEDLKDDNPRVDAKVALAVIRQKALHNQETLTDFIEKLSNKKVGAAT